MTQKRGRTARSAPASRTAKTSRARQAEWDLTLYITDDTPASVAAFASLKELCKKHLKARYRIRVIDLLKNPSMAREDNIVAIPTLVRKLPLPVKITIGDLSNWERVRAALGFPVMS